MTEWDYPRTIRAGDEYEKGERVEREKIPPDPEPEFMGEPWGESDHVPRHLRRRWNEEHVTYEAVNDDD
jgi:hypothetical protein